ncbi:MAG TPA: peptide ABC transporter substrate-binding protein [Lacunisphaera sp.]|jgi:oligopeptide transport system substrate-binding protein
MHRPALFSLLAALLCLLLCTGCPRRETPVDRGIREQVLERGLSADPVELDPHVISGLSEINVTSALFEGLIAEDPVDLHPIPGVAESWDPSPDGLVYTFHLRANAKWSNGDPVTAQDFANSIRRVLTRTLAADYTTMLYVLVNAEAYNKGTLTDFSQVGVQVPDAHTLRLTLDHPAPYFLSLLTHPVWYPIHLPTLEKYGSPYERGSNWTRPGNFVGNGPFVLKEWKKGELIAVEKSPTYWDAAAVRLNGINFRPSADVDGEERAFRGKQLHITEALPVGRVDYYKRNQPDVLQIGAFLDTYFYRLNITRPGLSNLKVRQALAAAIDRTTLVEKVVRGGQQPAHSLTPPGIDGYVPPDVVKSNYDQARQLLADAGYTGGQGLPELEITINTSGNHRAIAEAIQEMWRRELGVNVRIVNMEQATLLANRRTLNYQILRSDWAADYLDPKTFLDVFRSDSDNNHTGWRNSTYDALLFEADRTSDPTARHSLMQRAETILLNDAPIIPIYYYTSVRLVDPSVRGWHTTLLDRHPYKNIWLENPK